MNKTTQPGPLEVRLSDQLGRISPTALQEATKAVKMFGVSMAQAAQALQAIKFAGNEAIACDAALAKIRCIRPDLDRHLLMRQAGLKASVCRNLAVSEVLEEWASKSASLEPLPWEIRPGS
jgi:hypothetical protein